MKILLQLKTLLIYNYFSILFVLVILPSFFSFLPVYNIRLTSNALTRFAIVHPISPSPIIPTVEFSRPYPHNQPGWQVIHLPLSLKKERIIKPYGLQTILVDDKLSPTKVGLFYKVPLFNSLTTTEFKRSWILLWNLIYLLHDFWQLYLR